MITINDIGKAYILDNSDTIIGVLYQNLTTLKEKETTKNAADDTLVIENYMDLYNYPEEMKLIKNGYSVFIPRKIHDTNGKLEGTVYVMNSTTVNDDGGDNNVASADCVSGLIELLDEPIDYLTMNKLTPSEAMVKLLEAGEVKSRISIDYIDDKGLGDLFGTVNITSDNEPSKTNKLDYLVSMLSMHGGEISCRAIYNSSTNRIERKINWYVKRGYDRGKLLLNTKDLSEVTITVDTANIFTAVKGFGKTYTEEDFKDTSNPPPAGATVGSSVTFESINDGKNYIKSDSDSPRYAWCPRNPSGSYRDRWFTLVDDNITDPQDLYDAADRILSKCGDPMINVEAKIQSLSNYTSGFVTGDARLSLGQFAPEPWYIGDIVSIYTDTVAEFFKNIGLLTSKTGGIEARIIEYEMDHLDPSQTSVTINSTCAGITKTLAAPATIINKKVIIDSGSGGGWFGPWSGTSTSISF